MNLQKIVKKEYVENDPNLCFETIPISKIALLSIFTCGWYDVIFAYNYWKSLKKNFGYNVSPFWRGIFVEFTSFKLFPILDKYIVLHGEKTIEGFILALVFFISYLFSDIISLVTYNVIIFEIELAIWFLNIVVTVILCLIQWKINNINKLYYPDAPKNPWKISNIIWLIVFIILTIYGYLPE